MKYTKHELITILIQDFTKEFPDSGRSEKLELFSRLMLLEVSDLELLVSQLTKSVNS
jgi:hypothetical protein